MVEIAGSRAELLGVAAELITAPIVPGRRTGRDLIPVVPHRNATRRVRANPGYHGGS